MGIKFNNSTNRYEVTYSKRHPISRFPISRKRICNDNGSPIATKAEAERILKKIVIEVDNSFRAPALDGKVSYKNLLDSFIQSLLDRELTSHTINDYKTCLYAHTLPLWKDRSAESISNEEIKYLVRVKLAHRSVGHQKNMLKFLRGVFEYGVQARHLQVSPVPRLNFRSGDKIKKVLTEKQIGILLENAKNANHEWYPIWTTAVYTGMRNGELHALTWDKVDFDKRQILVSASWNKNDGLKDLTKSGEDRIVGVAPPLLKVLLELKMTNPESSYVLPRIDGWDVGRQAEILRYFLVGIGLPTVRFHDLRASWATVMLGKNIAPVKVMAMGGWKDLKTMMIYIRKAGINISGITDELYLHNPDVNYGAILQFKKEM